MNFWLRTCVFNFPQLGFVFFGNACGYKVIQSGCTDTLCTKYQTYLLFALNHCEVALGRGFQHFWCMCVWVHSQLDCLIIVFVVWVCVCVCLCVCVCVCDYRTQETRSSDTSLTLSAGCQETLMQLFQQLFSAAGRRFDGRSSHTDDWHCRVWCGIFQGWYSNIFIIKAAKSAWLSSCILMGFCVIMSQSLLLMVYSWLSVVSTAVTRQAERAFQFDNDRSQTV